MKRSLVLKSLIAILIVLVFGLSTVGCFDNPVGDVTVDKDALEAELALEVTAQGDYTDDSYNAYLEKLIAAKSVLENDEATQEDVDQATEDLTEARESLAVRPIKAVKDANKEINLTSGETQNITLADYVNENGLSNITYKAQTSSELVTIGSISKGKFTITAGDVAEDTVAKVFINVYYNNVSKLTIELTVSITPKEEPIVETAPTIIESEITKEYDLLDLENAYSIVIDFAENVNNPDNLSLAYSAKSGEETLVLDGSLFTFILGEYTEEVTYDVFTIIVSCTVNGETVTLEYTYTLGLRDTRKYSVVNGSFENGLDGWTLVNTFGDAPFGGIDNKEFYWVQNFPMFNVGSYFSAYADGASETSQGALASSTFVVNSEFATFMLGGAGNHNVYITIETVNGDVLALYRNTMFADLPAGVDDFDAQRELIGNTVFLANFVTYKVSLAEWEGMEIRFIIHDYASENWGVVFFDELKTYYESSDLLPADAILAENLLANKEALNAELALEVAEQGDFTSDSYSAYLEKLDAAKAIADDIAVAQETVDQATADLTSAREALVVRPVEEIDGAGKFFRATSGSAKEIVLSDYINTNGLNAITYNAQSKNGLVTISAIVDGKFTITAGEVSETTVETVSIIVYYNGVEKLVVEILVEITNDLSPVVYSEEVTVESDVFGKESIDLELSENIDNLGNLSLSYFVEYKGDKVAVDGSVYTFVFGTYTDEITCETLTVIVSYLANGENKSVSYTYKLSLYDSTANRLMNGGFELGLDGWTVVGNIGSVDTATHYWLNDPESEAGYAFGMDGEKMFSAYAPGALESVVGTLTSSTFKIGGSGFVTFKVGAMRDANYVYVDVVDAETKEILARYYNGLWADRTDDIKSGCTLVAYKADLSAFMGREVFFRISDNADSGYGLFFADSFITYYESEPDGFNPATPVPYDISGTIYDIFNGSFEMGNVQGWWNHGEIGVVTNANGYWGDDIPYQKVGDFLFTGVESFGADTMREGNRGVLTSSVFEIGGTGYISFKLGGGENALCYVQVIDAVTGEIIARYHQQAMQDAVLIQYVADLSAYIGRTARIQVIDQAENAWGCVSFDHVVTYYPEGTTLPESAILAEDIKGNIKYTIDNGSFENGLDGWTMNITEEGTHNTLGWVLDTEIDAEWYTKNDDTKDGDFLFTFVDAEDANCENTKGTLQSSTFSLKQGSFVSFKFGAAGGAQNHDVCIELCRADGSVIARFYNDADGKVNTRMNSYYYQYNGIEVECFFRVVDNSTGDYGCLVIDDFRVNLDSAPEGYIEAIQ